MTKKIVNGIRRFFKNLEDYYKKLLHFSLDHRGLIMGICAFLLIGSILLIKLVGNEFMPSTDEGQVRVTVEMEVGTKLELMDQKVSMISDLIRDAVPELESLEESFGGGGWRSGANSGNITLKLKENRTKTSEDVANDLRRVLMNIPGVVIRTRAGGGQMFMRGMGGGSQERIQIEIRGYDIQTATALAEQVQTAIKKVDGITDVRLSRESGNPEELLHIDRQAAADMNLSVNQIARTIQTVLSGSQASMFREGGYEYRILVKVKDSENLSMNDILDLTITNSLGEQISLRNVIEVQQRRGPVRIERRDRERVINVTADYELRDMGAVMADIQEGLKSIPIPRNFTIGFTGDYEEQQKAFQELLMSIILAILLVYMIMAMLYESIKDPFIVMFSVPMAVIGVVLMLFITNTTFNIQSYIGCIMLGGIVVNNAILLVDYTNLLRHRDKMPVREAIEEAGRRRLRPILMTALTTIMAMIPLALGLKEGSEAQAPMARAVIGGLLSSTLITLLIVPVVYSYFEGLTRNKKKQEA